MAVYRPSQARQQKGESAPKEPNLVPIMNLFITIIPFLMLMIVIGQAALIGLNFESSGEEGGGGEGAGGGGGEKLIEVRIYNSEDQTGLFPGFDIRDLDKNVVKLPNIGEAYDFISLQENLQELSQRYPDKNQIAVVVYPQVLYDTLIRTIDLCKQNGFVNVNYMEPRNMYYY